MRKRMALVLALVAIAGCSAFAQAKQRLTFVLTLEAKSLDPTVTAETAAGPITDNCFEGLVRLDAASKFQYVFDGNTALNAMESKKVDGLMGVAATEIPRLKAESDNLVILPRVGTTFIDFNVKEKPFDDPRVRRAFALAIDRKAICDSVIQAGEKPASGLLPEIMVYDGTTPAMMAPYVKGWYKLPIGTFIFKNAYIDKK